MRLKRVFVGFLILAVLTVGIVRPRPAHADTEDDLLLAGLCTAAYFGVVFLLTALVYYNDTPVEPFAPGQLTIPPSPEEARRPVHAAHHCAQTSPNVTLLCW